MIEWMKEILGDAYTEDIDNKITARLTADYAPKADLEAANTAKSEAEAALAAANDKYKDVDIDALRADAEKYKAEAAQARKDADERVAAVQFDGKLDAAITAAHGAQRQGYPRAAGRGYPERQRQAGRSHHRRPGRAAKGQRLPV